MLLAGPVTEVKTDIYVTSFGPVSDVEMVSHPAEHGALLQSCNQHQCDEHIKKFTGQEGVAIHVHLVCSLSVLCFDFFR